MLEGNLPTVVDTLDLEGVRDLDAGSTQLSGPLELCEAPSLLNLLLTVFTLGLLAFDVGKSCATLL